MTTRARSTFIAIVGALALIPFVNAVGAGAAPGNPSGDLDQCANGGVGDPHVDCTGAAWQNGNLNANQAHYKEGESVPYRLKLSNLSAGSHTVTIAWDILKGGKHALDYLTSFDRTETTADPCSGVSGCSLGSATTFPIPADPALTSANGFSGRQVPGVITIVGGTITRASAYTVSGEQESIDLTVDATAANPVLAWGGHIAERANWGMSNSAISISGSPYHMRFLDLDGSGGNQDRSLSASAVIYPARVVVVKNASPQGATSFPFTGSWTFSLADDGVAGHNTFTSPDITTFTSPFTVTEGTVAGWTMTSLSCADPTGGTTTNFGTRTASVGLVEGEIVTCTYGNTQGPPPAVTVTKTASPATVDEPGGPVTFFVTVFNGSTVTETLTLLTDSVHGNLDRQGTCAVGGTIAAGASYDCLFTAAITGNAGFRETDVVTAVALANAATVRGSDDAVVTVADVLPLIKVVKQASATTSLSGRLVTYTYSVTNESKVEPLTNVSATDDKCSPLAFVGGDANSDRKLDASETWTYTCTTALTSTTTNTATVTAHDDDGNTATNTARATVTVIHPSIAVVKSADRTSVNPGGTVVYGYSVTNTGDVPISSVAVTDNKCSPVNFVGGDANSDRKLDLTETWTYSCSQVIGSTLGSLVNIGTAAGLDPLGGPVSATDTHAVSVVAAPVVTTTTTAPPVTTTTTQAPAVLGETIVPPAPAAVAAAELPRTGTDARRWSLFGLMLVLLGAALAVASSGRRAQDQRP